MKISVFITNHNNDKYIAQCIYSVITQTYKDWSLHIVDDNSNDNSENIIAHFVAKYPKKIDAVRLHKRVGVGQAKHIAAQRCTNEIIAELDSDDALSPTCLQEVFNAYQQYPTCGMVYTNFWYCNAKLQLKNVGYCRMLRGYQSIQHEYEQILNSISHLKTYKKSIYEQTSGYNPKLPFAVDKDIVIKLLEHCFPVFVDRPLYLYRQLEHSVSHGPHFTVDTENDVLDTILQDAIKRREQRQWRGITYV